MASTLQLILGHLVLVFVEAFGVVLQLQGAWILKKWLSLQPIETLKSWGVLWLVWTVILALCWLVGFMDINTAAERLRTKSDFLTTTLLGDASESAMNTKNHQFLTLLLVSLLTTTVTAGVYIMCVGFLQLWTMYWREERPDEGQGPAGSVQVKNLVGSMLILETIFHSLVLAMELF